MQLSTPRTLRRPVLALTLTLVAPPAVAQTFTIVGLPDTQNYSEQFPAIYLDQTQWVADNLAALDVAFVNHYGDLVQNGDSIAEWSVADAAQATIDASGVPTSVTPGNHDLTASGIVGQAYIPENYRSFFPPERYAHQPWWGGASPSGMSSYQVWTGNDRAFLALSVMVDTPLEELAWAQGVLDRHRDKPVLFTTHRYLQDAEDYTGGVPVVPSGRYPAIWYGIEGVYVPGGIQSEQLWNWFVRRNPGVFMVNCGHFHEEFHQTSTNVLGAPVHEVLADYQDDPNGGNGWLRYYVVDPAANEIRAETYSPWLDQFRTAAESRFTLACDLDDYASGLPVAIFQEGVGGYAGTLDTWLNEAEPDLSYGESSERVSDDDVENLLFGDTEGQALLRFDGLVGPEGVPAGAVVQSATLSLELSDDVDNPFFAPDFFVHRVLVSWSEQSTWNSMGGGLDVGTDLGPAFASFPGDNSPDQDFLRRVDVTAVVQAWVDGEPNWGFAILPEIIGGNDDGIAIRTSESDVVILRPRLEVTYEEPCGATSYGLGAGGANTLLLDLGGLPTVGGTLVAITAEAPDAPVTTVLSLAPAELPLFGGTVLVDPTRIVLDSTTVARSGFADWIVPIPEAPNLAGASVWLQSFAFDPSGPEGLLLSNGLRVDFCQ